MAKRVMALLLCLTMMISLIQSVFASGFNLENLETIEVTEEKNMQDTELDSSFETTLISTEIGEGYSISRYSITSKTIPAGKIATGNSQYTLAVGDYFCFDFSFSTAPTGGMEVGGYNNTTGDFLSTNTTATSISDKKVVETAGAYSIRFYNKSSVDVVVTGTYEVVYINGGVSISVPLYKQAQTHWCWAACIQMCAEHFGYTTTQPKIVNAALGSVIDDTANASEIAKGMSFATEDEYTTSFSLGQYTISEISNILKDDIPVIIEWVYTNSEGKLVGHVVVVTAVCKSNKYIRCNDPGGNVTVYRFTDLTASDAKYSYYGTFEIVPYTSN